MATSIHPTALVEPGAELGVDCEIKAGAIVTKHCVLGDRVVVHPFAVIGGDPQDLRFDPTTPSGVRVGAETVLREHVTVNRSTRAGGFTAVGSGCFLMASAHVAHDCVVGDRVIVANSVLLAGHVHVGENAFLGGNAMFHQFCRIGDGAMVSGGARIALDLPPFSLAAERNEVIGLNLIGLKRRGFSRETIAELKRVFHLVYFSAGNIRTIASDALASGTIVSAEARRFLSFFAEGKRGFARARSAGPTASEE